MAEKYYLCGAMRNLTNVELAALLRQHKVFTLLSETADKLGV